MTPTNEDRGMEENPVGYSKGVMEMLAECFWFFLPILSIMSCQCYASAPFAVQYTCGLEEQKDSVVSASYFVETSLTPHQHHSFLCG